MSVGGGSATSGTDYTAVSDFTVTIPKESASGTGTFTLTPTNDAIAEGDETIDVTGTADRLHRHQGGDDPDRRRDRAGLDHADDVADLGVGVGFGDDGDGDRDAWTGARRGPERPM